MSARTILVTEYLPNRGEHVPGSRQQRGLHRRDKERQGHQHSDRLVQKIPVEEVQLELPVRITGSRLELGVEKLNGLLINGKPHPHVIGEVPTARVPCGLRQVQTRTD